MSRVRQELQLVRVKEGRVVDLLVEGRNQPFLWLHSGFRGRIGLINLVKKVRRDLSKKNIEGMHLQPNLVGFGDSTPCSRPGIHPYEMAKDLIEMIKELDLSSIHIVGYSLGANVGTIVANQISERVSSLVLLSIAIEGENLEHYRRLYKYYQTEDWDSMVILIANELVGSKSKDSYLKLKSLLKKQVSSEEFGKDLLRILDSKTRLDVFPELEKLPVPTLMISGLEDPFVLRPKKRFLLKKNKNIKMILLDGVGHNELVFPRQVDVTGHILEFWGF